MDNNKIISQSEIASKIYTIRNQRVMLDKDLAKLYQVETGYLNRQVKRNIERISKLDMPKWHIKMGRNQKTPFRFHRKWCSNIIRNTSKYKSNQC